MRLAFAALAAASLWQAWLLFELYQLSMPADYVFDESLNAAITLLCIVLLWFSPMACFTLLTLMFVVMATDFWIYGLDLGNELDRNAAISFVLLTVANIGVGYELWRKRRGSGKARNISKNMAGPLLRVAQLCFLGALVWDCVDIVYAILTRPDFGPWTADLRASPLVFIPMLLTSRRVPAAAITLSGVFASVVALALVLYPDGPLDETLRLGGFSLLMGIACLVLIVQYRRAKAVKDWGDETAGVFD